MPHILHINSDYIGNHLYSFLYAELDDSVRQRAYIPIKYDRVPEYAIDLDNTEFFFEKIIAPIHKYSYFRKILKLTNNLVSKKLHVNIDFIHAHNLFTDGGIAYNLKKQYGLKYIVAIRTTDIKLHYKYMFNRRRFAHEILKGAEHVIFISDAYKEKMFRMLPNSICSIIDSKVKIVPNGIESFWLDNLTIPPKKKNIKTVNLLYVGQIARNKGLLKIIDAVSVLNCMEEHDYRLTVVGGEKRNEHNYYKAFTKLITNHNWIEHKGVIKDRKKLMRLYRESDIFVMPSDSELFGLVYIEALSQGTPVIYSNGEGISSYLDDENVGIGINANDIDSLREGILESVKKLYEFEGFAGVCQQFDWSIISKTYLKLYSGYE